MDTFGHCFYVTEPKWFCDTHKYRTVGCDTAQLRKACDGEHSTAWWASSPEENHGCIQNVDLS